MALLAAIGYEFNDLTAEGLTAAGTATFSTTSPRTGARCGRYDSGGGGAVAWHRQAFTGVVNRTYYAGGFFRLDALPASTVTILAPDSPSGGSLAVQVTSAGKLLLWNYNTGTQVGSDSVATLTTGVWYRLDLSTMATGGAGSDAAELRLDGVVVATSTTLDLLDEALNGLWVGWPYEGPGTSKVISFDDVLVNDDQGANENTWAGDHKIDVAFAISDNNRGAWTGGSGGTTSLFDAVNNAPSIGTATETDLTQIESAATSGTDNGDFNCETYTTLGIVSGDTVRLVQPIAMHGEDSATGTKTGTIKVQSNPSGTVSSSFNFGDDVGALGTHPTNWRRKAGTVDYLPSVTLGNSPVVRITKTSVASAVASCELLAVIVVWTPATAIPASMTVAAATAPAAGGTVTLDAAASLIIAAATAPAAGGAVTLDAASRLTVVAAAAPAQALAVTLDAAATLTVGTATASAQGESVTLDAASVLTAGVATATAQAGAVTLTATAVLPVTNAQASAQTPATVLVGQARLVVLAAAASAAGEAVTLDAASVFTAGTAQASAAADATLAGQARLALVAADAAAQAESVSLNIPNALIAGTASAPAQGEGVTFDAASRMVLAEALASAEAGTVALGAGEAATLTVSPAASVAMADVTIQAAAVFSAGMATAPASAEAIALGGQARLALIAAMADAQAEASTLAGASHLVVNTAEAQAQGEAVTFDAAGRLVLVAAVAGAEGGVVDLGGGVPAIMTAGTAGASAAATTEFLAASRLVVGLSHADAQALGTLLTVPGSLAVSQATAIASALSVTLLVGFEAEGDLEGVVGVLPVLDAAVGVSSILTASLDVLDGLSAEEVYAA